MPTMKLNGKVPFRTAVWGLLSLAVAAQPQGDGIDDGLYQAYCSSENTGSNYQGVFNAYQSNGACLDQCKANYAFAVVQYQMCWCSNYIPAIQENTSNCNQKCPGFPSDQCGNANDGLYGYVPLFKPPSGTAGAASSTQSSSSTSASFSSPSVSTTPNPLPTSGTATSAADSNFASSTSSDVSSSVALSLTTSSTSSSRIESLTSSSLQSTQQLSSTDSPAPTSYVSQTVVQTVTQTQSPSVVVSYVTPTSSSSSELPSSTFTSSSASTSSTSSSTTTTVLIPVVPATTEVPSSSVTRTPSAVTSVRIVTVSGAVVTQTVTSTPVPAPGQNADATPLQQKGLSGGAIAGIVIGALLGALALAFAAFLLWRRRPQKHDTEGAGNTSSSPKRHASVLSKTGLISRDRPMSMTENNFDEALNVNTGTGNNSVRHSMLFGAGAAAEGVSPVSPLGSTQDIESRRHSKPLVYDQRLNPSALFANADANGSRVSVQDAQDYSRPLGVANPDLRASLESRISRE